MQILSRFYIIYFIDILKFSLAVRPRRNKQNKCINMASVTFVCVHSASLEDLNLNVSIVASIDGFTLEGALWVIRARFQRNKAAKCTFYVIFPF